jgi:reactive intermediate/imine deaminase
MAERKIIKTDGAPGALGTYSQAVQAGDTLYISGQVPLDPVTMETDMATFEIASRRVFNNLKAVAEAAGGSLNDAVKLNIYMTDLANFATVNTVMAEFFDEPYPARAAVGVASLPKDVPVEIEAILVLDN